MALTKETIKGEQIVTKPCAMCENERTLDVGCFCLLLDAMIPRDVVIDKKVYSKCPIVGGDTINKYWKELVQLRKENGALKAQIERYREAFAAVTEIAKEIKGKAVDLSAELNL